MWEDDPLDKDFMLEKIMKGADKEGWEWYLTIRL